MLNLILWLWIFLVPAGIFSFIGFILYNRSSDNLPYFIVLSILGCLLGILWAEHVRKKYGLDAFFGKLLSTPGIDGNDKKEDMN